MVETIAKHPYVRRQTTYKKLEADEKTFTSLLYWFGRRRNGDSTPTYHESLSVEQDIRATSEQHQQPPIEEPSTQEDYSLIDLPATND